MYKLFIPRVVAVIPLAGEMSHSDKRVLFSEKIPRPQKVLSVFDGRTQFAPTVGKSNILGEKFSLPSSRAARVPPPSSEGGKGLC